jgi:hypothetical protein
MRATKKQSQFKANITVHSLWFIVHRKDEEGLLEKNKANFQNLLQMGVKIRSMLGTNFHLLNVNGQKML